MIKYNTSKNLFLQDKIIRTTLIVSIILVIISSIWIYLRIKPSSSPIAMRYSLYFGVDLIGEWWKIYLIPGVASIIIIVNFIIARYVYLKAKILSYFLSTASSLLSLILLIISILITLLNS